MVFQMDKIIFFLLLVFGITTTQGNAVNHTEIRSRIVGGVSVPITSFPYMAALIYQNALICGGSIIGPSWVLTTLYCAAPNYNYSEYKVRVGSADYSTGGILCSVQFGIMYDLTISGDDDMGLIKLKDPLVFSASIKAIKLPTATQKPPLIGTLCQIAGWGNKNATFFEYSKTLQMVNLPLAGNKDCSANCYQEQFSNKVLCTWSNKSKALYPSYADNGAPLVTKISGIETQIGLYSRYPYSTPCKQGVVSMYTFIPLFRDWIKNKTGI